MGLKDQRAASIKSAAMSRLMKRGAQKQADNAARSRMLKVQAAEKKTFESREDVISAIIEVVFDDSE